MGHGSEQQHAGMGLARHPGLDAASRRCCRLLQEEPGSVAVRRGRRSAQGVYSRSPARGSGTATGGSQTTGAWGTRAGVPGGTCSANHSLRHGLAGSAPATCTTAVAGHPAAARGDAITHGPRFAFSSPRQAVATIPAWAC